MRGDGGKKDKRGFAIFSTLEAGWAAFTNMVKRWQTGKSSIYKPYFSLREWATQYDPLNPNYAQTLANHLGVRITTMLKDIPADVLAKGIALHEDGDCYQALKDKGIIQ